MLNNLGYKRGFSAIAECTRFDAAACLEFGMVNQIVPAERLLEAATEWAESLSKRAPLSLKYTKKILQAASSMLQQDTARLESEYQNKCLNSIDSASAINAFLNKEEPVFIGQ